MSEKELTPEELESILTAPWPELVAKYGEEAEAALKETNE